MVKTEAVYEMIETFIAEHGYAPSIRDIQEQVGLSSTSNVFYHLEKLRDEGSIQWERGRARSITLSKELKIEKPCVVDGCTELRWRGPKGTNPHLTMCQEHQTEDWRVRKEVARDKQQPERQRRARTEPKSPKPLKPRTATVTARQPKPSDKRVKVLLVDHRHDVVQRFEVPLADEKPLSSVRNAARLIEFYRQTGHIIVQVGAPTEAETE